MKKFFLSLTMLVFAFAAMSQNLESINDLMGEFKYKEAKTAIDKYLSNPKKATDAEAWYYKGRIYNALSNDSTVPQSELLALRKDAFAAFQENQKLDKKDVFLALEAHVSYLNVYYGFYDLGAKEFNAKNYDGALTAFKWANDVKDFILEKKYTYTDAKLSVLDTSLIMNIGASAIQAKKEPEAIAYYMKIINAGVTGSDYRDIYEYVAEYYSKSDNESAMNEVLAKAKKAYPTYDYWMELSLRYTSKKGDPAALMAKYEQLIAENPTNFVMSYNYAVELYNSLYGKDAKQAGDSMVAKKLTASLKNTISLEKDDNTANVLMCNHLYNMSSELVNATNAIKVPKGDDIKKKSDLKAASNRAMDECISYSEMAVKYFESISNKTNLQKANYKIVLGYLSDIYTLKKNPAKAAEYEKKYAAADKL